MNLIEIDVVHAQPAKTVVDRMHDVLARQPAIVRVIAHRHVNLRRNDDAIAPGLEIFQSTAQNFLALSGRVHVRRVEIINSEFDRFANEWTRLFLLEHPGSPLFGSIGHCAEAQARHFESGRSKIDVVHRRKSLSLSR
jgi:hypothetical protein